MRLSLDVSTRFTLSPATGAIQTDSASPCTEANVVLDVLIMISLAGMQRDSNKEPSYIRAPLRVSGCDCSAAGRGSLCH